MANATTTTVTSKNIGNLADRFRFYDFGPLIEEIEALKTENQSLTDKLKAVGEFTGLQTEAEEPATA